MRYSPTSALARAAGSAPLYLSVALALTGCGDSSSDAVSEADVVAQYVAVVRASYADTLEAAITLQGAVDAFVKAPSEASLAAAREAWIASRDPYLVTEAYRFYEGPIDEPTNGPEGRINGWPLDEAFIDYVVGDEGAGMISHPELFPTLSTELLSSQNERGGEENIATGYHAIEFLLWGQDLSADGPGARPFTDYVEADAGPGLHASRRGSYLTLAAELLVTDLTSVRDAWGEQKDSYASQFLKLDSAEALAKLIHGLSELSGNELSGERMQTALQSMDQEDEHSCFSDNTQRDLLLDAVGIEDVYLGRYGELDGPGLDDLLKAKDAALEKELTLALRNMVAAMEAIPTPFDKALREEDGRSKIKAAIEGVRAANESIAKLPRALDL